ncbi:Fibronectin [Labeo rohita]|uniref:Fibronectin n=1 Tax=Labeo rohita TaxID=84645 RepID=A0ABQ8M1A9_LABRO|nr:Fibronectin [Labeo rohita]
MNTLSQNLQSLGRHFVFTGSPLRTSVQKHCDRDRCLQDGLGHHMQWSCSLRGLDRPSATLAYQLPGVADSVFGLEGVPTSDSRQTFVGQQQQTTRLQRTSTISSLPSHATCPPSPTLEPAQTQVFACHSHPGQTQLCSRFSLTTSFASGQVKAPPSDGPADLESIRPGTSRSVCLTRIHSLSSLTHYSEEKSPLPGEGHNLAPTPRSLEPLSMVPGHDQENFKDLAPVVVNILTQARASSSRPYREIHLSHFSRSLSPFYKDCPPDCAHLF